MLVKASRSRLVEGIRSAINWKLFPQVIMFSTFDVSHFYETQLSRKNWRFYPPCLLRIPQFSHSDVRVQRQNLFCSIVGLTLQHCGSFRFFRSADCTDLDAELFQLTICSFHSWSTALWLPCAETVDPFDLHIPYQKVFQTPWYLDGIYECFTLCNNFFSILAFVYITKFSLVDFLNGDHVSFETNVNGNLSCIFSDTWSTIAK
jgi:hypothetical protein